MIQDFFRLQGINYQGIVKSTVSGVFEDLKFKISEGYKQTVSALSEKSERILETHEINMN